MFRRLGLWTGIGWTLLTFLGFGLQASGTPLLGLASSDADIAQEMRTSASAVGWTGLYLDAVSPFLLVVFVAIAVAYPAARRLRETDQAVAAVTVGGAVLMAATYLSATALQAVAALRAGQHAPEATSRLLADLIGATYVASWPATALLLLGFVALCLKEGSPRWLAASAAVLAGGHLVATAAPMSSLSQVPPLLFAIWVSGYAIAVFGLGRRRQVDLDAALATEGVSV